MEFQDYAIKQTFEKWDDMMLVFLTTVDGRNIPPVDSLSHYLQGFVHPISSINGMKFARKIGSIICRLQKENPDLKLHFLEGRPVWLGMWLFGTWKKKHSRIPVDGIH